MRYKIPLEVCTSNDCELRDAQRRSRTWVGLIIAPRALSEYLIGSDVCASSMAWALSEHQKINIKYLLRFAQVAIEDFGDAQ